MRLGRRDDRDRGEVGRERRPGAVLDLRDLPAEVVLDHELAGRAARARVVSPTSTRTPSRANAGRIETRSRGSTSSIVRSPPVTAARPMKLPTSMCSGATRHSPPARRSTPLDAQDVRLDPLDLRAERDEEAAEILDVRLAGRVADHGLALGEHGGHDDVLGRHHARLVEEDRLAAQRRRAHLVAAVDLDLGAELGEARGCAGRGGGGRSRRRRAAARSRGRSARAAGRRAGTTRGCAGRAPRRAPSCARPSVSTRISFSPVHSTSAPMSASSSTIVCTSRIRGTFVSVTGSVASTHAARIGSAPFLLPAARIVPPSGRPPSITKACIPVAERSRHAEAGYRRRPMELTRDRAWETLTRYTKSESLLRHALAVEASTRSYARRFGEDEELWGVDGAPARLRLRDPPHARQASAGRRADPARGGLSRGGDRGGPLARRAPGDAARHAAEEDALRLRRALGLRARVRARAPDRARGAGAEVGEEEAEAAVVRRRRPPRRGLRGRRAARRRARRAHRERRRGAAADREGARPADGGGRREPSNRLLQGGGEPRRDRPRSSTSRTRRGRGRVPGRSRTTTPAAKSVATSAGGSSARKATSVASPGTSSTSGASSSRQRARLLRGALEAPLGRQLERGRRARRGSRSRSSRGRSARRRRPARSCRSPRRRSARSSSAGRRAAAPGRRRRARPSRPGRRATSGRRSSGSRARSRRPGSRRPTARRRRGSGRPVCSRSSRTGSARPVVQSTCESASRRVRGVTAARIASGSASTTTTRAPLACTGPEQAEVLLPSRDDLVLRAEVEPGEDDVAAVRRRAGERHVLRLGTPTSDAERRPSFRPQPRASARSTASRSGPAPAPRRSCGSHRV